MAGMLDKLHGDEAVLLMYLADELPREERVRVERRLAGDARLREELERLRALNDAVMGKLEELDALEPAAVNDDASTRAVLREMRRYQVGLTARPKEFEGVGAAKKGPVSAWWYGVGAAAAAVVIFTGLWGAGLIDGPGTMHLPGDLGEHYVQYEEPGQEGTAGVGPSAVASSAGASSPEASPPQASPPQASPAGSEAQAAAAGVVVDVDDLARSFDAGQPDELDEARLHLVELESLADAAWRM